MESIGTIEFTLTTSSSSFSVHPHKQQLRNKIITAARRNASRAHTHFAFYLTPKPHPRGIKKLKHPAATGFPASSNEFFCPLISRENSRSSPAWNS